MRRILCILTVIALFSNCSNETNCSGFPENRIIWLPYNSDETATFSCSNSKQTFVFSDVYNTMPYTVHSNESRDCECIAHCYSDIDSVNNIQLKCDAEKLKLRTVYRIQFQHYGQQSSYYVPTHIDFFEFGIKTNDEAEGVETIAEMQINGQTYNDVLKIETDTFTNHSAKIYKVYMAPECGIIRYDYREGKSFVRE